MQFVLQTPNLPQMPEFLKDKEYLLVIFYTVNIPDCGH